MDTPSALTNLGTVITSIMSWLGDVLDVITGEPILLIGLGIFTIGACIGLISRLFK